MFIFEYSLKPRKNSFFNISIKGEITVYFHLAVNFFDSLFEMCKKLIKYLKIVNKMIYF